MSDARVPPPDFDESRYERPNKHWICGRTCDGCPCRIGPGPGGECRATTECRPVLACKPGETKGTWQCTRPKEWGGACESGPLPDGSCCKSIPKCRPVRSLRGKRGLLTRAVVAACVGGLLIALTGPARETFLRPAPLSPNHTGVEFEKMAAGRVGELGRGQGCVTCHVEIRQGFAGWASTALKVSQVSLTFTKFISPHPRDFSRMDASCVTCHQPQSFHQANVARDTSCSICHLEHQGSGPLPRVASAHCTDCHGDPGQMSAAAAKGRVVPAALLERAAVPGLVVFTTARPPDGFTRVIPAFANNHPEFRLNRPGEKDPDTLAFNHALHLRGDIPTLAGKPLDCANCHRPDASGAYMQRVSFEQNCRSCHSLQFDERNPGMQLPHGDSTYVRAYLRSLPAQYADYGTRKLHLTGQGELQQYVEAQMLRLRDRARSGEQLEEQVFFSDAKRGPVAGMAGLDGPGRARFAGCALCHEVTPRANAAPYFTAPVIPDRWMTHAQFNHAKHGQMACLSCHAATKSKLTSDIIMPSQQSCVACHGAKGGVSDSCTECHRYHNRPPAEPLTTVSLP